MKKKHIMGLLTAALAAAFIFLAGPTPELNAAAKVTYNYYRNGNNQEVSSNKLWIPVLSEEEFEVAIRESDAEITNLKTSSKNLDAEVIYHVRTESTTGIVSSMNYIGLYARKTGTYTVSFVIEGQKYKLKVKVVDDATTVKSVTYGSHVVTSRSRAITGDGYKLTTKSNLIVSGDKKKLTVKGNKDIKITGFVVRTTDKKGNYIYKKYKNGAKVTLSKKYTKQSTEYITDSPARSLTNVYVSYQNTFTKEKHEYSVGKNSDTNEEYVKHVVTYPDGTSKELNASYTVQIKKLK